MRWKVGSVTANAQNKAPPSPQPKQHDMVHKSGTLIEAAKTECVSQLKHAHNVTFWSQTAWQMLAKPVCVYCNLVNEMKLKLKLPPVSLTDTLCQHMIWFWFCTFPDLPTHKKLFQETRAPKHDLRILSGMHHIGRFQSLETSPWGFSWIFWLPTKADYCPWGLSLLLF